jgi:hypothetical protein
LLKGVLMRAHRQLRFRAELQAISSTHSRKSVALARISTLYLLEFGT